MKKTKYSGAILAAGRGSRMAPFNESYPKPILPVCNKPVIAHQIEIMKSLGIEDIVVLVGHKGFEIAKVLGDGSNYGVSIRYVEQTAALGIAHGVGRLESSMDGPFMLFLGDVFLVPGEVEQMLQVFEEQGGGAVLATKDDTIEAIRRNFAIFLSPDGSVSRVVEKPRYTDNRLKGVGLYLFDQTIFDAIRRTPRTAMRDEYEITTSIQVLIDDGLPVRTAGVILDDINLTTPADLLRCNLMEAAKLDVESLVGENSSLNPNARLKNCIVGSNVTIEHPIEVANSVFLDGSHVDSKAGFENFIVAPDCVIDCRALDGERLTNRAKRKGNQDGALFQQFP